MIKMWQGSDYKSIIGLWSLWVYFFFFQKRFELLAFWFLLCYQRKSSFQELTVLGSLNVRQWTAPWVCSLFFCVWKLRLRSYLQRLPCPRGRPNFESHYPFQGSREQYNNFLAVITSRQQIKPTKIHDMVFPPSFFVFRNLVKQEFQRSPFLTMWF